MGPNFRTIATMGKLFHRLPSDLLLIADPTVAMAVNTAATLLLTYDDREHDAITDARMMNGLLTAMVGSRPKPRTEIIEEW
jgi:hypothetical protein